MRSESNYDLEILDQIDKNPEITQAALATQLGVAVGSVNWYIKRLINKGYIKVSKMQRRRLRYLLTPQGFAEKTRLTGEFMKASLKWYRETRVQAKRYLEAIKQQGYTQVYIEGDGDLAEVVYLTCLEAGMRVQEKSGNYPKFYIEAYKTKLVWPNKQPPTTINEGQKQE